MAVLTWRNVDAPHGDGAIQGLATAAGLLTRGTNGLSDAIGKFGADQTTIANDAVAQAASRYQTADGLRKALADGSLLSNLQSLGIDPSNVNAAQIGALQKGVDDRVNNDLHSAQGLAALQKGQYDTVRAQKTGFDLGVSQRDQSALSAIMPYANRVQTLRDAGRFDEANALVSSPEFQQLSLSVDPETLGKIMRGSQDAGQKTLDTAGKVLSNQVTARDQAASVKADQAVQLMARHPPTDAQGMSDYVASLGLDPQTEALARKRWNESNKDYQLGLSPAGSGGIVGGGGAATGDTNPMRLTLGGGQVDPSIRTVGDVVDNGKALADAHKTQDGTGHSNVGPYQITAPTWADFAPKALGKDWRNADINDYATHDKVASAIWDTVKNDPSAMVGRWTSLTPATASALKGADWSQAREVIGKGESSTSPAAILAATARPQGATSASLAPGEQDVTPAPASGASTAIAKAAQLPSIDELVANSSQSKSVNAMLQAGSLQHGNQIVANTGIDPEQWVASMSDKTTSPQAVAHKLVAKGGQFDGQNENRIQRMIEKVMQSPEGTQRDGNNKAVAQLTAAAAGQLIAQGNGVIKSGDVIDSTLGTWLDGTRLSTGQNLDMEAAKNLLGSINAAGITKAVGVSSDNKQAQSVAQNAQKALDDVTSQVISIRKQEEQGHPVDPGYAQRVAHIYAAAKERRDKAWEKLNGPNSQQTNVKAAAAKIDAAQAADAEGKARLQQMMIDAADPTKNPLAFSYQ
jgi:hypothetical protein